MLKRLFTLFAAGLLGTAAAASGSAAKLGAVLDAQPDEVKARYPYRHCAETITFFGIEPGMTVVEGLPDTGWYSKILLPYLGKDGHLVGADYAPEMWPLFGFFPQDFVAAKQSWVADWTADAIGWSGEEGASVSAFQFGAMPEEMKGTADAVLMVRATHNLARFEGQGGFLTSAVADIFNVLKPGGILGIVQHEAREEMPDEWADGSRGYLKESFVIETFENAGFVLEASNDINNNPKDRPTTDDFVWRLPPTLATSGKNEALKAEMLEIGESHRMTLRFRKPG
jgi:predicted methyltransferase